MRGAEGVPSLRSPQAFRVVCGSIASSPAAGFRVIHFSVQRNHIHVIAEADRADARSRGIRSLTIRLAVRLNRLFRRSGAIWGDRCHVRALSTPTEVRNAIANVLMNFRKHGEHLALPADERDRDPFSSAACLDEPRDTSARAGEAVERRLTSRPHTWLARTGWST
ncbi:MAG TPA: hypothetical protein VFD92_19100 [Candidatus Binatia bacterium]|nr:hypothetical protein [Candidatus Binatia bacterium]